MEVQIKKIESGKLYYVEGGEEKSNPISSKVNPMYVRAGIAEISVFDNTVTYVSMSKKETVQTEIPEIKPADISESKYRRPIEIIRQECLAEAVKLATLNSVKAVKIETVLEEANKLVEWVSQ